MIWLSPQGSSALYSSHRGSYTVRLLMPLLCTVGLWILQMRRIWAYPFFAWEGQVCGCGVLARLRDLQLVDQQCSYRSPCRACARRLSGKYEISLGYFPTVTRYKCCTNHLSLSANPVNYIEALPPGKYLLVEQPI